MGGHRCISQVKSLRAFACSTSEPIEDKNMSKLSFPIGSLVENGDLVACPQKSFSK